MLFIVLIIFRIIVFFLAFCYINGSLEEHFLMNVIPLIKLFDDDDEREPEFSSQDFVSWSARLRITQKVSDEMSRCSYKIYLAHVTNNNKQQILPLLFNF